MKNFLTSLLISFLVIYCSAIEQPHSVNKRSPDIIVTDHDFNMAIKYAQDCVSKMQRLENSLKGSGIDVKENSPSHGQLIESFPWPEALVYGRNAFIANKASQYLGQRHCRKHHLNQEECSDLMKKWSLESTPLRHKCAVQFGTVKCKGTSKYRSTDGSCNHLNHPSWGQAFSAYKRLLPASYADGVMEPRRSENKAPLPSPRQISNSLISDLDRPDKDSTLALAQWGQFIANDLFQTAIHKMVHTGSSIECCRPDGKQLTPRYLHPQCMQISVPNGDPDFSPIGVRCLNYVRSVTSLRDKCNFGTADQMNQATHFLDGSMIYGNTAGRAVSLRGMNGGRLATTEINKEEYLPLSPAPEVQCQTADNDTVCYVSGDSRVNLNPHLTTMYTLWMREHNRIATALSTINPHWDDKQIYQEAKRIVVAQIQHITYKTWLPTIVGEEFLKSKGLAVKSKGFGGSFDEETDPSISNAFATAGFNFINSFLEDELEIYDEQRKSVNKLQLEDHFNKPAVTQEKGVLDGLARGLSSQKTQQLDASIVEDLTSKLYKGTNSFGYDIMSLDIQRGRDHGLPGYNKFREFCRLPSGSKFETFLDTMPKTAVNKLKNVYNHPNDVDLVIGAILESPGNGAKVGPTLQCLLSEQFGRTRRGDRYFYDLTKQPSSFTEAQVNELKKANLARIVCDNALGVNSMQINVFQTPSATNPMVDCSDSRIPEIKLAAWKDVKY